MGILDFVKSDEKRASSPDDDVARGTVQSGWSGEVVEEEAGDDLHRGMKPRQLSECPSGTSTSYLFRVFQSVLTNTYAPRRYGKFALYIASMSSIPLQRAE